MIVPIGGGGLIAGIAFTIKSLRPDVKVYGVQAAGAPSMYLSVRDHRYQTLDTAATFADGIQVKTPGELTMSCAKNTWTRWSPSARTRSPRPSCP